MDPMRSSSAPSSASRKLQSHTTAKRRPPHHIPRRRTPSPAAAQQRTNFGRHPVIPPLGQPWPKPQASQPQTPITRPVAAPQHGQRRQSQVTTMHQRPNHMNPLQSHFPFHTPLQVMPGYNYMPVMYPPAIPYAPPMMHPQFMPFTTQTTMPQYMPATIPYPSLTQYMPATMPYPSLTQYMPAAYPHSYTSLFPQPIVPEITELSPRESTAPEYADNRERHEVYRDKLLQDDVTEEVCHQLIESCLNDLVREVVNGCIDDIIRNYLGSSRLLAAEHSDRHRPVSVQRWRPSSHPTIAGAIAQPASVVHNSGVREDRHWGQGRQHSKLMQMESDSEVSHYLSTMLLDELILSQLLHSLCDGGLGMTLRMQAQHTLNGLLFDKLLERLCQ